MTVVPPCGGGRSSDINDISEPLANTTSMRPPTLLLPLALQLVLQLVLALVLFGAPGAQAARILTIVPTASISHQLPFRPLMKALAERGHQVTVITTDPLEEPVANYTEVDISFSYEDVRKSAKFADMSDTDVVAMMKAMAPVFLKIIDTQLSSKPIQDFIRYNASQGYDLVIMEWLSYQAYYGLVHAVGSPPLIGMVTVGGMYNTFNSIGNPDNPAINPQVLGPYTDNMNFWERLHNAYQYLQLMDLSLNLMMPQQEDLMRKHFGSAPPPVKETEYNLSLLVVSNHWCMEYPRALLPNVVQLSGLHVRERPRPLPPHLQAWLDGATAGAVYFSLGSNVMSKDLPSHKRHAVLRALGRLPPNVRVLWKWEEDALPGCPPNVLVGKWLPQQDILAHPNVRLFITQGGLQSFQEAAYHAVPLLGIPFIGDQPFNVAKMVAAGIGERLDFDDLTEDTLYATIRKLLDDPGYSERMRRFSAVFREHKAHSLDTALWWVEYVLRHQGAPHMRAASLRLRWYELLLLDVAAAVLAALLAAALVAFFAARALWRTFRPNKSSSVSKGTAIGKRSIANVISKATENHTDFSLRRRKEQ